MNPTGNPIPSEPKKKYCKGCGKHNGFDGTEFIGRYYDQSLYSDLSRSRIYGWKEAEPLFETTIDADFNN